MSARGGVARHAPDNSCSLFDACVRTAHGAIGVSVKPRGKEETQEGDKAKYNAALNLHLHAYANSGKSVTKQAAMQRW